jgi:hypothetical protein
VTDPNVTLSKPIWFAEPLKTTDSAVPEKGTLTESHTLKGATAWVSESC